MGSAISWERWDKRTYIQFQHDHLPVIHDIIQCNGPHLDRRACLSVGWIVHQIVPVSVRDRLAILLRAPGHNVHVQRDRLRRAIEGCSEEQLRALIDTPSLDISGDIPRVVW